jgi:Threonine dehydratase
MQRLEAVPHSRLPATLMSDQPSSAVLPTLGELEEAATVVYDTLAPTPQYRWPLLAKRTGVDVVVKHENHQPFGAFKIRGGLTYFQALRRECPDVTHVIAATRGNHGQSIGFAAKQYGMSATVVVPRGNSPEKNAAMRSLGVRLVEEGEDFQDAADAATRMAADRGWHKIPSFHPWLVRGVATAALELLRAEPSLEVLYVPIGLGSSICGAVAARDALGLRTRIIGVVSSEAPAYARSFAENAPISCDVHTRIADGMACRTPVPEALAIIRRGVERIVTVTDAEVERAMRSYFTDTHNVAEGAGAASLAALLADRDVMHDRCVAVMLSGGNVDAPVFARVLGAA